MNTEDAKALRRLAVIPLLCGALRASAEPVTVWMKLPAASDLALRAKALEAAENLKGLLAADAEEQLVKAPSGSDPWLRLKAGGWSTRVDARKRGESIMAISAVWDLRIVEHKELPLTPAESGAPTAGPASASKGSAALSSLSEKLSGRFAGVVADHYGRIYDGSSPRPMSMAVPVAEAPKKRDLSARFEDELQAAAASVGIDPKVLRAVAQVKSGFNPQAASGRAHGLMAISEATGNAYGYSKEELLDPETNLRVGAQIIARLLERFEGDLHKALAAYQVGPSAVLRSGGIPNDKNVKEFLAAFELCYVENPDKPRTAMLPTTPRPRSPQVETIRCGSAPISKYRGLFQEMGGRYGIDPHLLEAMVRQENPWGDPCRVSDKGAIGLGQLMPDTAAMLGVKDPYHPRQNILGMAKHLKYLLSLYDVRYENGVYLGPLPLALAAYNAGEGNVEKAGNKIPNFNETRNYIRLVLENYFALTGQSHDWQAHLATTPARKILTASAGKRAKSAPSQPSGR